MSIWYFIQLQCTHLKVKFKGKYVQTMRSFVLVIKNNEAVLVIKCKMIRSTKQQDVLCAKRGLRSASAWASAQSGQSLRCPTDGSLGD